MVDEAIITSQKAKRDVEKKRYLKNRVKERKKTLITKAANNKVAAIALEATCEIFFSRSRHVQKYQQTSTLAKRRE